MDDKKKNVVKCSRCENYDKKSDSCKIHKIHNMKEFSKKMDVTECKDYLVKRKLIFF